MSIRNDLKAYIISSGKTMIEVSELLGISQSSLSQQLSRESIKYSKVLELADVLGYEIIWKKKE